MGPCLQWLLYIYFRTILRVSFPILSIDSIYPAHAHRNVFMEKEILFDRVTRIDRLANDLIFHTKLILEWEMKLHLFLEEKNI